MADSETGSCSVIPYHGWSPEVSDFHETLYSDGIILPFFDWDSWQDEVRRFVEEPGALAEADELTVRRLLTTHARRALLRRALIEMFQFGHMAAILRRLKVLQEERR